MPPIGKRTKGGRLQVPAKYKKAYAKMSRRKKKSK